MLCHHSLQLQRRTCTMSRMPAMEFKFTITAQTSSAFVLLSIFQRPRQLRIQWLGDDGKEICRRGERATLLHCAIFYNENFILAQLTTHSSNSITVAQQQSSYHTYFHILLSHETRRLERKTCLQLKGSKKVLKRFGRCVKTPKTSKKTAQKNEV